MICPAQNAFRGSHLSASDLSAFLAITVIKGVTLYPDPVLPFFFSFLSSVPFLRFSLLPFSLSLPSPFRLRKAFRFCCWHTPPLDPTYCGLAPMVAGSPNPRDPAPFSSTTRHPIMGYYSSSSSSSCYPLVLLLPRRF